MVSFLSKFDLYQQIRIVFLTIGLSHVGYLIIFLSIGELFLAAINIISVSVYSFYTFRLKSVEHAAGAFTALRLEMLLHAFICGLVLGWDYGFQNILLGFMSVAFFSSLSTKFVNTLFAYGFGGAYLILYFFAKDYAPAPKISEYFYIGNFLVIAITLLFLVVDFIKNFIDQIHQDMLNRQEALSELANKDPLTGLLNKNAFYTAIAPQLTLLDQNISIVLCDIDNFKKVNDTYGHNFGDEVLKMVANTLKSSLRENDHVFRWGGEEFLIVLGAANLQNSKNIFERIRHTLSQTKVEFDGKSLSVTVTFGLINFNPLAKSSLQDAIRQADKLLYEGKNSGKNMVVADGLAD